MKPHPNKVIWSGNITPIRHMSRSAKGFKIYPMWTNTSYFNLQIILRS